MGARVGWGLFGWGKEAAKIRGWIWGAPPGKYKGQHLHSVLWSHALSASLKVDLEAMEASGDGG